MLSNEEYALVQAVKQQKAAGKQVSRKDAQKLLDLMKREQLSLTQRALEIAKREGFDTDGVKVDA